MTTRYSSPTGLSVTGKSTLESYLCIPRLNFVGETPVVSTESWTSSEFSRVDTVKYSNS